MSWENVVLTCNVAGVIVGILAFSFFSIVIYIAGESGGSAAANRLPPLMLCSLISIASLVAHPRAVRRDDELWASFLQGLHWTAYPVAVLAPMMLVKSLLELVWQKRAVAQEQKGK
eukprot:TRINITY_DN88883_c0_g1_i1.p1 TRINITY_DN88883_c0_g1~~TRINITY_DN88883_c0_g1_i1.p1  ORF type:complete len:128 (+),score=19.59 TRINITY_DN88883_c0_g1_i1:39-386(+)